MYGIGCITLILPPQHACKLTRSNAKPKFLGASGMCFVVGGRVYSLQPGLQLSLAWIPRPWIPMNEFRSGEPPKSRIRVGFGFRVSSIETNFRCRFRVSSLETNFRCRFRVSGFGFRRLKTTFAVGFGFRVSISPGEVKSSESVSGFGFRSVLHGEGQSSESVSGFGFRVSIGPCMGKVSLQSRFRVSGFGFRSARGKVSLQSRFRVSGFGFRSSKPTLIVGFGFRVSGFAGRSQLCRPLSGSRLPWTLPHTHLLYRIAPQVRLQKRELNQAKWGYTKQDKDWWNQNLGMDKTFWEREGKPSSLRSIRNFE